MCPKAPVAACYHYSRDYQNFKSLELTNVTIDKNWKSFISIKSDGNDEFEFGDFEPSIPARL